MYFRVQNTHFIKRFLMSSAHPEYSSEPVLHYWNIKARNYAIAVIAKAGGFPLIENKSVHIAEAKPWLPFGQFPYLTHGPVRMAQSGAIMRYVASKAGLDGREDDVDFATCQMLLEEHQDLYTLYAGAMYAPEGRAAGFRALFEPGSALHKQLRYLERILDGKEHFCSKILAGDYAIAAMLEVGVGLEPSLLTASGEYPALAAFFDLMMRQDAFVALRDSYDAYFHRDDADRHHDW